LYGRRLNGSNEKNLSYILRPFSYLVYIRNQYLTNDKEKNILHIIKRMQADLIGHSMCRNCLLKHGTERKTEGRVEVKGRRRRRRKNLLDGLKK
jgi:hypothetical protein